jgi:hypothetical protein
MKMKNLFVTVAIGIFVTFSSCKKDVVKNNSNSTSPTLNTNYSTALMSKYTDDAEAVTLEVGDEMTNPYTVENMKKAAEHLNADNPQQIKTTHKYIRFLPRNEEEVISLIDNQEIRVFEYPLDRKLTGNTCGYHDKTLSDNQVTWLYASIPISQGYPSSIQHEELADLYIPSDEEYILEATALEICGYKELAREMRENATGKTDGAMATTSYRPTGTLKVYNNTLQREEPLRNVKITMTTFFKWNDVWTDRNGNYTATKNFLVPVDMWITFGNGNAETRTLSGSVFPYYRHLGNGKIVNKTIWDNWGEYWKVATVNNSVEEFYDFNNSDGVLAPPSKLRVWIKNEKGSVNNLTGATPLLSKANLTLYFNAWWNYIFGGLPSYLVNSVYQAFKAYTPDILILLDKDLPIKSLEISKTIYHELAHASHFSKVGSQFWNIYVNEIINNSFKDFENPYAGCNSTYGGLISISEAWGYYREYWFTWLKYNSIKQIGDDYWDLLELSTSSPASNTEGCIKHPFFWDIFDNGKWEPTNRNGIIDNVEGGDWTAPNFTNQKMFDCLESTTQSPIQFRDKFIQRYGQSQSLQINQLFQSYGY